MASEKEKVAVNVLVDHFGDIVAKTVTCLLAKGPRSMRDLCSETKLKANEVILISILCLFIFVHLLLSPI